MNAYKHLRKFLKKQPSKAEQLEAVKQNGYNIRYIRNPDKDVQLAAVEQNGINIRFIHNPDKDAQLAAVKQDGYNIVYCSELFPELLAAYLSSKECPEELKQEICDPSWNPNEIFYLKPLEAW